MNDNNGKILALDEPFSEVKKECLTYTRKRRNLYSQKMSEKSSNNSAVHTIHRELIE